MPKCSESIFAVFNFVDVSPSFLTIARHDFLASTLREGSGWSNRRSVAPEDETEASPELLVHGGSTSESSESQVMYRTIEFLVFCSIDGFALFLHFVPTGKSLSREEYVHDNWTLVLMY